MDAVDLGQMILSMATADVDRDGDLDIVAGTADRTRLYLNEAAGNPGADMLQITAGPEVIVDTAVRGIAISDIDHRAGLDYVLDTDLGIRVHLGSLTAAAGQSLGGSRQAMSAPIVADLDLDGQVDLIYGDAATSALVYHMGLGASGSGDSEGAIFGERRTVELTSAALQVLVTGMQPGGLPEIVVLTMDGASRRGRAMRLLAADGQGRYTVTEFTGGDVPPDDPPAGDGALLDTGHFTIADLEGDARPDVILAAAAIDKVVWLRNQEGRDLPAAGVDLLSAPMPWSVLAADLTGDGIQNVLVSAMSEIHVLLPREEEPPPVDTFALTIVGSEARQGDTGVSALIRLTNSAPLEGYEMYVSYDPAALAPTGTSTEGTALETDAPEFVFFEVRGESATIALSAIMEFQPPFEGRTLPPHDDDPLLRILFDVPEAAPTGETRLEFTNETILVSGG
ncbi:MAG: hypothetical protein L0227_11440, partial [Chloroflexi bacterium]|nr:hypothetical protein [Chloroflexota bacterium]